MKTLIIGDTHFHDSNTALRNAQIQAADVLYEHAMYQRCDRVVFLGDVFDKRKPSPACILDVKEFFDNVQIPTHIIRGNHDSANKSDDGLTILSLLHRDGMVEVHNRWSHRGSHVYLSHFEHEEQIKALLAAAWPARRTTPAQSGSSRATCARSARWTGAARGGEAAADGAARCRGAAGGRRP